MNEVVKLLMEYNLPRDVAEKIDMIARQIQFKERVIALEQAGKFALNVRVNPNCNYPKHGDDTRTHFIYHCFARSMGERADYTRESIMSYMRAFIGPFRRRLMSPEELTAAALSYSPDADQFVCWGFKPKPSLPKEIELKIHGYRIQAFNRRIKEFEVASKFAMSARYDQATYMKYMNMDVPDFNRDSFILHCMRRSMGSVSDWRPGPEDIVEIDYMKYSEEYKDFLLLMCIKYLMSDVMIAKASVKLQAYLAGEIDVDGLGTLSDDDVFDGYDEYSSD